MVEVGKGVLGNSFVRTVEFGAADPTVAAVVQEPEHKLSEELPH